MEFYEKNKSTLAKKAALTVAFFTFKEAYEALL